MKKNQKLVTALVTIVAATATAHLMQRNGAQAAWMSAPSSEVQTSAITPVRPAPTASAGPEIAETDPDIPADRAPRTSAASTEPVPGEPAPADPVTASDAEPVVVAAVESGAEVAVPGSALAPVPDMPRLPAEAIAPAPLPASGSDLAHRMETAVSDETAPADTAVTTRRNEFGLTCGVILSASEKPGALINLMVTDPCRGDEPVIIRHGDLVFSGLLSRLGSYTALVPALQEEAVISVEFADGETSETELTVATAADYERAVLLTDGETGLQIHALEFGADYDTPGHVWAGQPRNASQALAMGGGFITQLGEPSMGGAQMAEVYTFPADARIKDGVVRLSIEAEVTAFNCAKDVAGQTLQRRSDGEMTAVSVTLAMPDCEAIGEFLVLKNLLQDLKIASN